MNIKDELTKMRANIQAGKIAPIKPQKEPEIAETLNKLFWDTLKDEEGITPEDLEMIDLDIEFSPVIQFKGGKPVEVTEATGKGQYIVNGMIPQTVGELMLKVMRYRYLSNRNNPFVNINSPKITLP